MLALTPSPSPTLWERGVVAHGGAPCCAFPLSREAGEGGCGVRKRSFRLMLKLRFSTPKGLARGSLSCKWAMRIMECGSGASA